MTPEVSDLIQRTLEDTDKYIEVADGHHVTAKQKASNRNSEHPPRKCFRCGSEYHMIENFLK